MPVKSSRPAKPSPLVIHRPYWSDLTDIEVTYINVYDITFPLGAMLLRPIIEANLLDSCRIMQEDKSRPEIPDPAALMSSEFSLDLPELRWGAKFNVFAKCHFDPKTAKLHWISFVFSDTIARLGILTAPLADRPQVILTFFSDVPDDIQLKWIGKA